MGIFGALFFLIIVFAVIWGGTVVARKAGHSPWWAVLLIVPVANLVIIWLFAFADWPAIGPAQSGATPPPDPSV